MKSRGFQLFVLIFCGVVLALGIGFSFLIEDTATKSMLFLFGGLYVVYVFLYVSKRRQEREKSSKQTPRSPLMK